MCLFFQSICSFCKHCSLFLFRFFCYADNTSTFFWSRFPTQNPNTFASFEYLETNEKKRLPFAISRSRRQKCQYEYYSVQRVPIAARVLLYTHISYSEYVCFGTRSIFILLLLFSFIWFFVFGFDCVCKTNMQIKRKKISKKTSAHDIWVSKISVFFVYDEKPSIEFHAIISFN